MELLKITLEHFNLNIWCSPWIWGTLIFVGIMYGMFKLILGRKFFRRQIDIEEFDLGIGSYKVKIKPNFQTIQVAYKLWVELNTRKLGIKIDKENDVISEVYDSWYSFFGIARELMKEIPAQYASNKDTKKLIIISTKILNKAIRPHLTKWQARYRDWYKRRIVHIHKYDISPQELQKQFKCSEMGDCYNVLMDEMIHVNNHLINYRMMLEQIVFGESLNK